MTNLFEQALVALFYWLLFSPPSHLSVSFLFPPSPALLNGCKGGIFWRQQTVLLGKPWTGSWGKRGHQVRVTVRMCVIPVICVLSPCLHVALILSCWLINAVRLLWGVNVMISQWTQQPVPWTFYMTVFARVYKCDLWLFYFMCICRNVFVGTGLTIDTCTRHICDCQNYLLGSRSTICCSLRRIHELITLALISLQDGSCPAWKLTILSQLLWLYLQAGLSSAPQWWSGGILSLKRPTLPADWCQSQACVDTRDQGEEEEGGGTLRAGSGARGAVLLLLGSGVKWGKGSRS